jgi:hypothetical protein
MVPVLDRPSLALHQLRASFGVGFHPVEALSRFIPSRRAGVGGPGSLAAAPLVISRWSSVLVPVTGTPKRISGARNRAWRRNERCEDRTIRLVEDSRRARSESRTPSGIAKVPSGGGE